MLRDYNAIVTVIFTEADFRANNCWVERSTRCKQGRKVIFYLFSLKMIIEIHEGIFLTFLTLINVLMKSVL